VICGLAAALTSAAPPVVDVEALMARFLADSNVVGVSVGVEQASDVIVRGGWGLADRGTGRQATAETVYRLGSSSKQFTAALVMKLVERGVVGLDDPVDRHLPQMPRKWLGITIRQLLNHTSGVPNFTDTGSSHWAKKLSPAGLLALVSSRGLQFPAGSKYAYSNSNYVS
jgi:CubicO group peptidase (beta-lactamase class C family)